MDANEFDRISNLVVSKQWDAHDAFRPDGRTMLDMLVELLTPLKPLERVLVSDLLADYLVVWEYNEEVIETLNQIVERSEGKPIIVSPVKDFKAQKVKSGSALTFEFNRHIHFFPDSKFTFTEDPSSDRFQSFKGFRVLVDDFIGSGNQFLEMTEYLAENNCSSDANLVTAIVIQEEGKQKLEEAGFQVYSPHERTKSIKRLVTDEGYDNTDAYGLYDEIEARLGCHDDFKRGFGQSEATVTLKKTPNNTLPIFWYQGKNSWPAPFPRPRS